MPTVACGRPGCAARHRVRAVREREPARRARGAGRLRRRDGLAATAPAAYVNAPTPACDTPRCPLLHLPNCAATAFGDRPDRDGAEPGFVLVLAMPSRSKSFGRPQHVLVVAEACLCRLKSWRGWLSWRGDGRPLHTAR
jgi:hypothetical protein